jgi:hypothetical protein
MLEKTPNQVAVPCAEWRGWNTTVAVEEELAYAGFP